MDRSTAPTVLIVDDEDYRQVMRFSLEREGYHIYEATNGIHAVELAQRIQPALILMDLSMPVLDGILLPSKFDKNRRCVEYLSFS